MSDFDQLLACEPGAQEDCDTVELMEDLMLPSMDQVKMKTSGPSNVMVDQSPLQPQLQKNKECKSPDHDINIIMKALLLSQH